MMSKRCAAGLLVAAASWPLSSLAAHATPVRTATRAALRAHIALSKPQPMHVRAAVLGSMPTYTVVDHGAPASPSSVLYNSVAFNNTGQIVGFGSDDAAGAAACFLFDGSVYRDISTLPSITFCNPNAISEANATSGAFDVVGYVNTQYSNTSGYGTAYGDYKALYLTATPKSNVVRTAVFTNDQSSFVGVNAAGTALGTGDYYPLASFASTTPPFVVTPEKGSLSLLQPACTTIKLGCGDVATQYGDEAPCGFGGCLIAADGTLLLYDLFSGSYEVVAPNGTTRDIALDANLDGVPIMNNAKQIAYAAETVVAGTTVVQTRLFSVGAGTVATVPSLKGMNCGQYVPVSLNNKGRILGYASGCDSNYGFAYFTFDAATGTQELPSALPGNYFSFFPHAINDKNQILVDLELTSGGASHWGYLQPAAAAASSRVRASAPATALVVAARNSTKVSMREAFVRPELASLHNRAHPRLTPRTGRPIDLRTLLPRASAPTYTLVDYGAPAATEYTLGSPLAFNNNGQILGAAADVPYRENSACLLFDGLTFRNLGPSSVVDCSPLALSDENPLTGTVNVVGYSTSAYDAPWDAKAFFAVASPKSGAISTRRFAANDDSLLAGVNAMGAAIGVGAFAPTSNAQPQPFELAPGENALVLLPSCVTANTCGFILTRPCAFGGCDITADGTLFLDGVLISPGGTKHVVPLDSNAYGPIINNNGQILYADGANTELYTLATGRATKIPQIPGQGGDYEPLSFNNAGHVLGRIHYDSNRADSYYVYDATNGTRFLSAELPSANALLLPVGINDQDQILVELTLPSGVNHWGILRPPAATSSRLRAGTRSSMRQERERF